MKEISSSQQIFHVLMEQDIGYRFDCHSLKGLMTNKGIAVTDGAITGFIARNVKVGNIKPVGITRSSHNMPMRIYEIINKQPWAFKNKSIGSKAGRTIHQEREPMELSEIAVKHISGILTSVPTILTGVPTMPTPNSLYSEENKIRTNIPLKDFIDKFPTYSSGSISDQMLELAIQVNQLENKPDKSLADYSTDELINEIKKRLK